MVPAVEILTACSGREWPVESPLQRPDWGWDRGKLSPADGDGAPDAALGAHLQTEAVLSVRSMCSSSSRSGWGLLIGEETTIHYGAKLMNTTVFEGYC